MPKSALFEMTYGCKVTKCNRYFVSTGENTLQLYFDNSATSYIAFCPYHA